MLSFTNEFMALLIIYKFERGMGLTVPPFTCPCFTNTLVAPTRSEYCSILRATQIVSMWHGYVNSDPHKD